MMQVQIFTPSFRGDAKHRTRNLEFPRCAIAHSEVWSKRFPDYAEPVIWRAFVRPCPTGKSVNCCPAPFAKIFLFRLYPNHIYIARRLVPLEGRIAIVTDAGRDAVDAAASGV